MADIFLSYNEKDRDAVRRLAEALQSTGWSVWWDRRIPAGLTWRGVLERELQHMRCIGGALVATLGGERLGVRRSG